VITVVLLRVIEPLHPYFKLKNVTHTQYLKPQLSDYDQFEISRRERRQRNLLEDIESIHLHHPCYRHHCHL
jgi:hypothetical protein